MAKVIKVSELGELTRKNAVFAILDVRDKVGKQAKSDANNAISTFSSSAPKKTGSLSKSVHVYKSNKSNSTISFDSGKSAVKAYSTNKYGVRRGWLDRWKKNTGNSFLGKF